MFCCRSDNGPSKQAERSARCCGKRRGRGRNAPVGGHDARSAVCRFCEGVSGLRASQDYVETRHRLSCKGEACTCSAVLSTPAAPRGQQRRSKQTPRPPPVSGLRKGIISRMQAGSQSPGNSIRQPCAAEQASQDVSETDSGDLSKGAGGFVLHRYGMGNAPGSFWVNGEPPAPRTLQIATSPVSRQCVSSLCAWGCCRGSEVTELGELASRMRGMALDESEERQEPVGTVERSPVLLVLDSVLQGLPWESLPGLRGQR